MAKHKNQRIICSSPEQFRRLVDEYRNYAGREVASNVQKLEITVFSLPKNSKRKAMKERKLQRLRQAREASYGYASDDDYSEYADRYERV